MQITINANVDPDKMALFFSSLGADFDKPQEPFDFLMGDKIYNAKLVEYRFDQDNYYKSNYYEIPYQYRITITLNLAYVNN